jgi:hypothetical protein
LEAPVVGHFRFHEVEVRLGIEVELAHRSSRLRRRIHLRLGTNSVSSRVRMMIANSTVPLASLPQIPCSKLSREIPTGQRDSRAASRHQPEKGQPPLRQEAEGAGEQAESQPAGGQGEPLERRGGDRRLRGDSALEVYPPAQYATIRTWPPAAG